MKGVLGTSRLARSGTALALLGQWGKLAVQLAGIAVLSRVLPHTAFGSYAMIIAVVGIAMLLGDLGLSLAAVRDRNITDAQASNLFWVNCAIGVTVALAVVAVAPVVAGIYDNASLAPVVRGLAPVFLFSGCSAQHRAHLNRRLRFGLLAAADVLSQVVGLLVAVPVALSRPDVVALVVQQVVAAASGMVLLAVFARWVPRLPSRAAGLGTALQFGAATSATQVVNYLSSNVDFVAIGRVWGPDVLGVYSRAFQICALPLQQLASPLTRVVLPVLANADAETARRYLRKAQLCLTYALIVSLGCLFGAADLVVRVLLGDGWEAAALYVRVLAVGGVFQVLGYVYYWAFLAAGRMGVLLVCETAGRLVLVGLIVLMVGQGPEYVAVAYAVGLFAIWLITTVFGLRRIGLAAGELVRVAARPALLSSAIAAALALVLGVAGSAGVPLAGQLLVAAVLPAAVAGVCAAVFPAVKRDFAEIRLLVRGAGTG